MKFETHDEKFVRRLEVGNCADPGFVYLEISFEEEYITFSLPIEDLQEAIDYVKKNQ